MMFEAAIVYTLQNEGGFVNDPADNGGATNFGITQKTLSQWRGDPATADDVKEIDVEEAKQIYFYKYWKVLSCDQLTQQPICTAIFDTSVLYGVHTGATLAQLAANNCGAFINVDGQLGPASVAALNKCDPAKFISLYHGLVVEKIEVILNAKRSLEKFRDIWIKRADRLFKLLETKEGKEQIH